MPAGIERDGTALEIRGLDPALRLPLALVSRRERDLSPAARAFIELVRRETTSMRS
jgi:DNA-binding transcriptional LysR family regulator